MNDTVHFVHISDSHLVADEADGDSAGRLQAVVEQINAWVADGVAIDFVVHTGDLVDDADLPGADAGNTLRGVRILAELAVPWYLLNGNHDRLSFLQDVAAAELVQGHIMATAAPQSVAGPGLRRVGLPGIELLFINANPESPDDAGNDVVLTGYLDSSVLRQVAIALQESAGRLAIFLHYPPLAQEALWPRPPSDGEALHALLAPHADRIAGVFAGHVHRSIHHLRDGILYVSVPPVARHFLLWPGQAEHALGAEAGSGLHYVTIDASGTRVQHHAIDVT